MPDPVTRPAIALAIDCAFGPLSAAIVKDGATLWQHGPDDAARAAEGLPSLIDEGLTQTGLRLSDIGRLAVTVGPGGFTSLRAGMAYAKGLAFASRCPLMGFSTLEALALSAGASPGTAIAAAIDAKRDEVFLAVYRGEEVLLGPALVPVAQVADRWPDMSEDAVLCGSGSAFVLQALAQRGLNYPVVPRTLPDPSAMAREALRLDPAARPARAFYLREADARLPS